VKSRFLLNVVVRQSSSIFQLFTSKNKTLLFWWNSFLVLNFCFDVGNGIVGLDIKSNRFTSQRFHKDLHSTTSQSENQVKRGLFLDVIIGKSTSIFKLFTSKDQSLLFWWNSFFVLDLGFDVGNGIIWLDIQSNGFTG